MLNRKFVAYLNNRFVKITRYEKSLLLTIFLFVSLSCMSQQPASSWWSFSRDTLSFFSRNIHERPKDLADTLKIPARRFYFDKKCRESFRADGGVDLAFSSEDLMEWERQSFYVFPVVLRYLLDDGVYFEIDWTFSYPREDWTDNYGLQYDSQDIRIRGGVR